MAQPTNSTKWADDNDALKVGITEERQKFGWKKLSNGFGERPSIFLINGWYNLVYRWIEYLFANRGPVGTMIWSVLDEAQFNSVVPSGDWVLCDGRDVIGTSYYNKTNFANVPDMRGLFSSMPNHDLSTDVYQYHSDSISNHGVVYEYENGENFLRDGGNSTLDSNFYTTGLRLINNGEPESYSQTSNESREIAVTRTDPNASFSPWDSYRFSAIYNSGLDLTVPGNVKEFGTFWTYNYQEFDASAGEGNFVNAPNTGDQAHTHELSVGHNRTNIPSTLTSSSVTSVSGQAIVDLEITDTGRLLPETICLNCFIRIN